jgi:hypothetical protein
MGSGKESGGHAGNPEELPGLKKRCPYRHAIGRGVIVFSCQTACRLVGVVQGPKIRVIKPGRALDDLMSDRAVPPGR